MDFVSSHLDAHRHVRQHKRNSLVLCNELAHGLALQRILGSLRLPEKERGQGGQMKRLLFAPIPIPRIDPGFAGALERDILW